MAATAAALLAASVACGPPQPEPARTGVPDTPPAPVAVLSHGDAGMLSVLDTRGSVIAATIRVGSHVGPVALGRNGTRAFVSTPDGIAIVDLDRRAVIDTVRSAGDLAGIAVAGERLYVVDNDLTKGHVSTIERGGVLASLTIDHLAGMPVLTTDARWLFVPHNFYSGRITAIDARTLDAIGVMTVEDGAARLGLSGDDRFLYVPNGSSTGGRVTVFDTATRRRVADIDVAAEPVDIAVSDDGRLAYVALFRQHAVGVLDLVTHQVTRSIDVPSYPICLALNAAGTVLYVLHNAGNELSIIDLDTSAVASLQLPAPALDIVVPTRAQFPAP